VRSILSESLFSRYGHEALRERNLTWTWSLSELASVLL